MLAISRSKSNRLALIGLGLLFAIYVGYVYSIVRSADTKFLVTVALGLEPIQRFAAGRELRRQIKAGESNGVDALSASLSISSLEGYDEDEAFELANELLESGVDINGENSLGHTPLGRAINFIEPSSVTFLLEHCADADVPLTFGPDHSGPAMNALEWAYFMEREFPHLDYSSVIEVLEHSDHKLHCDTQ